MKQSPEVDAYLAGLDPGSRTSLEELRRAIRAAVPQAAECISYGMPAFRLDGKLIAGFRAAKHHCSYYPMSGETVATLRDELAGYETSRGMIRFSANEGLPEALVLRLLQARIAELEPEGGRPA